MSNTYDVTQYSVNSILGMIEAGDIAIPEIQRPFVWKGRQVRDFIDSLYNGYPTGYLIIWQGSNVRLKNGQEAVGKRILIDGQQRVTALKTAITGHHILTEDYEEKPIRIAFNPIADDEEERFAVQTPVHFNSKHWIPDIAEVFKADFDSFTFITKYAEDNPEINKSEVNKTIMRLLNIRNHLMGTIMLNPQLDISQVTEIFVRINSQGKRLNEADFAMSKIAADEKYGGNLLRKAIDYFCHLSVAPHFYSQLFKIDKSFMNSEYAGKLQWLKEDREDIYDPDYGDMLRVSFMHVFKRGRLGDLVSLLSGRDFHDKKYKEEIVEDSFDRLKSGVINFMNEYSFKQFILAIKSAGFISPKLLNSQMTLDFAYTLYLLLHQSGTVPKVQIQRYIQKWFILSTLTSRYIGSPESQMDRDLHGIEAKGFVTFLEENEASMLSDTFWNVRLVQNLETSSITSPYFNAFVAAQVMNNDRSLFSNSSKVADLIMVTGDVHHIFPKEYLKQNGFNDKAMYNQVANCVYLDTGVNKFIGKQPPNTYFTKAVEQCTHGDVTMGTISDEKQLWDNLSTNCIPQEIVNMDVADYTVFLQERRKLMARKIRDYYQAL